jgi:hypothetical protein
MEKEKIKQRTCRILLSFHYTPLMSLLIGCLFAHYPHIVILFYTDGVCHPHTVRENVYEALDALNQLCRQQPAIPAAPGTKVNSHVLFPLFFCCYPT